MQDWCSAHGWACTCASRSSFFSQDLDEVKHANSLCEASRRGDLKRVKELLQRESLSSINSCSICGLSPLLYAARKGNVEVIRLLLASGADVNHVTPSLQSSVLHRAALSGKLEAVQMLLERDRKLVIRKDVDGKLPVDKAANEAIRSLLLEAQADLERGIDS